MARVAEAEEGCPLLHALRVRLRDRTLLLVVRRSADGALRTVSGEAVALSVEQLRSAWDYGYELRDGSLG
jgi:hypothetical protein